MKQILITILLLGFFASTNAQTKLIVIYDDDCSNCKDLLEKKTRVKTQLKPLLQTLSAFISLPK